MKLATHGIAKPCNYLQLPNYNYMGSYKNGSNKSSFKITNSWSPKGKISGASGQSLVSKAAKLKEKWMEFQGIKNWDGLLDPLDDGLRDEILRYGEFVEAAYRCFDFDTSSPGYATCQYAKGSMLTDCGLGKTGYKVTRNLHATCGVHLPSWADERMPSWVSTQSSWIGYVAVCNDKNEIARLGRRDVVIAYRGTATCMEWLENMRATLTRLPSDMAGEKQIMSHQHNSNANPINDTGYTGNSNSMVQSGFLSLYTSSTSTRPSLQDSIREEISKILEKYADEPLSITVTGHSLGAALATLTAHDIATTFKHAPLVTVVSFGGPRVGNKNFRSQLEKSGTKVLRIVNSDDPITKVPGFVLKENKSTQVKQITTGLSDWLRKRVEDTQFVYAEIGKELRLSSRDCPDLIDGSVAACHDLKTYLHLVDSFVSSSCSLGATEGIGHEEEKQVLCG